MGSFSSLRLDVFLTKPQENKDINFHFFNGHFREAVSRLSMWTPLHQKKKEKKKAYALFTICLCSSALYCSDKAQMPTLENWVWWDRDEAWARPLLSTCFFLTSFLNGSPLCHHLASAIAAILSHASKVPVRFYSSAHGYNKMMHGKETVLSLVHTVHWWLFLTIWCNEQWRSSY